MEPGVKCLRGLSQIEKKKHLLELTDALVMRMTWPHVRQMLGDGGDHGKPRTHPHLESSHPCQQLPFQTPGGVF